LWTLLEPEDRSTTFHRNGRNSWSIDSVRSQTFKRYISLMIDSVLNYKLPSLQFIYRQSVLISHMCLDLAVYRNTLPKFFTFLPGHPVYRSGHAILCLYFFSIKLKDELYKTIIMPVTSYGCELRPAFSRVEHRLMGKFIGPTLHALKCEHDRCAISYMFRHFLSAVMRQFLYRLKLCPSNWSAM
jgi:hypothetical protein